MERELFAFTECFTACSASKSLLSIGALSSLRGLDPAIMARHL
jgi:hypothetical protein